jgi:hypothetical protein
LNKLMDITSFSGILLGRLAEYELHHPRNPYCTAVVKHVNP